MRKNEIIVDILVLLTFRVKAQDYFFCMSQSYILFRSSISPSFFDQPRYWVLKYEKKYLIFFGLTGWMEPHQNRISKQNLSYFLFLRIQWMHIPHCRKIAWNMRKVKKYKNSWNASEVQFSSRFEIEINFVNLNKEELSKSIFKRNKKQQILRYFSDYYPRPTECFNSLHFYENWWTVWGNQWLADWKGDPSEWVQI